MRETLIPNLSWDEYTALPRLTAEACDERRGMGNGI